MEFLNRLSRYIDELPIWVVPAVYIVLISVLIVIVVYLVLKLRQAQKYVSLLRGYYDEFGDVVNALNLVADDFNNKGRVASVVKDALYYIEHSIRHDYASAFALIESAVQGKKVKETHDEIIRSETEKKRAILLLPLKSSQQSSQQLLENK